MKRFGTWALWWLLGGIGLAQAIPHLAYIYPPGGRPGATINVVLGGQYFSSTTNFFVVLDADYARQAILSYDRQLKPEEQQAFKEELSRFQEKRKKGEMLTPDEKMRAETIKQKLTQFGRRPANPALGEFMTVQLTLPAWIPPGDHEIRVQTPAGLSNPVKYCVALLPEITKPDWKAVPKERGSTDPTAPPPAEITVKLPVTLDGQIAPAGVDRYHFWAQQGQQLVIIAEARRLMPYLADAVPGWFEATLTLLDPKGREVASAERYRFRPDPVIHFQVPHDGSYTVEVRDSLYRGREDFIYRLTLGELPFVTSVFPLGGKLGEKSQLTVNGWNLPEKSLAQQNKEIGLHFLTGKFANAVPFSVDDLPEQSTRKGIRTPATAQAVTLPVILNGCLSQPGEHAVFKFEGRAGQNIVAEVLARRLDSPLDSSLRLTDANGQQLAFNDDYEDKGTGLNTHHADSYLTATLPAQGVYYIHLTDTVGQGGPDFAYRLRLSEPRPDFELRVVPSSLNLRTGLSGPLTVLALRRDGFTNAINLELKSAPEGFSLSGARIPAGQDKLQFTLKAPPEPTDKPVALSIEGSALVSGKRVVREAVPAEDMMQAFIYRHLVPSKYLLASVNGPSRWLMRDSFKILSPMPAVFSGHGNVRVRISLPAPAFLERFTLELNNPAEGISLEKVVPVSGGVELVFAPNGQKLKPGAEGSLICGILRKPPETAGKTNNAAGSRRPEALATLPAISYKITDAALKPDHK